VRGGGGRAVVFVGCWRGVVANVPVTGRLRGKKGGVGARLAARRCGGRHGDGWWWGTAGRRGAMMRCSGGRRTAVAGRN